MEALAFRQHPTGTGTTGMRRINSYHLLVCLLTILVSQHALADQPFQRRDSLRQRIIQRFDKDGDGQLSSGERAEMRKSIGRFQQRDTEQNRSRHMTWTVNDVKREAIVYLPTEPSKSGWPIVFAFHGHGGNSRNAARKFAFQKYWPEAMVVYMQGLPTPGKLFDPEGKRNGWQHGSGDQDDRDLKFFDTVLSSLHKKYKIDDSRIYATGHSNGGAFTYLIWATRPHVFAAVAPSAAASRSVRLLTPKPAMHIAGKNDQIVKFSWQQRTISAVRKVNDCDPLGRKWATDCTLYTSRKNTPFVTLIHSGDHTYPQKATPLIVRFFKENSRKKVPSPGDSTFSRMRPKCFDVAGTITSIPTSIY